VNQRTTQYQEHTGKKDQWWAFLARGTTSPAPDEGDPTFMAVATPTADEHGRTCKTPSKRYIPVTNGTTLTPYRLGDTSTRQGYGDGPVDDPVSIRGHFG
jgi:hypothetical protein